MTTATCRNCGHPVVLTKHNGWVDTTPAYYGGLYDFCTVPSGAHDPEKGTLK